MDEYVAFVTRLAGVVAPANACNPYGDGPGAEGRRHNLALYLARLAERRPRVLLVGEAPGYRGCRLTGVPFTSQAILLAEPSPFGLFGRAAGYRPSTGPGPAREATATVLWETLVALAVLPLLWNACPLHPHQPGRPDSNRAPAAVELALGRGPLEDLLGLFEIERVIAVGNVAAATLARWGIPAARARHPGHGGKAQFTRDLEHLIGK